MTDVVKVITIDGPAGAGKSTVAKNLAQALKYSYLDTGAMYRSLTLKALNQDVDLENEDALVDLAKQTSVDFKNHSDGTRIYLDGEDVSEQIRDPQVTNKTFYVARTPRVREIMVQWQRNIGQRENVVVEGRDVGTVVFPSATRKFYLDADVNERARRRIDELRSKGSVVDDVNITSELKKRDQSDLNREVGPLKKADDAILIDSTHLSADQVVEEMLKHL